MNLDTTHKRVHQGRNIKRLREMLGVKQETLAIELDVTQATVSKLEAKEELEKDMLERIAKVLKIPVEAIENFNDEGTLNFVANTFNNHDNASTVSYQPTFNPIDKIVELYTEKEVLYERMIKEKNDLIERLLEK
ncbi:XRE family transcriptional regulator [Apibacter muscae]|uniref:helix-turn-helix transcriptional regulator n=1 Tax=Apibacter muscae TaxID=2509004 RepID=UPI0011ACC399|nr:helix-turn-helix transcriptional regulator [Apibacter muscae]TWP23231.1 XRE family transcriptional regulator [Apibacter muscae]